MRRLVADASFCGAWILNDEASEAAEDLLEGMLSGSLQLVVPALWYYEMANMLKSASLRRRLSESNAAVAERLLSQVPIHEVDTPAGEVMGRIVKLAADFELSAYDAAYLELSDRLKIPLLTSDKRLKTAHEAIGK